MGVVSRRLAGVPEVADARGNRSVDSVLGPDVEARDSVFVGAQVLSGNLDGAVLLGTQAGRVAAAQAFDIRSTTPSLVLGERGGTYRVVDAQPVVVGPGERRTTVFFADGPVSLRVQEDTPLRDKSATYDVPILGNAIAFRTAHARAIELDPSVVQAARDAASREASPFGESR
jgi:hypothetical protein